MAAVKDETCYKAAEVASSKEDVSATLSNVEVLFSRGNDFISAEIGQIPSVLANTRKMQVKGQIQIRSATAIANYMHTTVN
jgi:hypothetical protein